MRRGREQPGSIMIQQAAAVQRVRLPVRYLRSGSEFGGLAREACACPGRRSRREADGVGQQVLDVLEFF